MPEDTVTLKKTVEEDVIPVEGQSAEDTARYHELDKKKDKTPEEYEELADLKKNYGSNVRNTISKLTGQLKDTRNMSEEYRKELEDLKRKNEELESKINETVIKPETKKTTVKVGDKSFYTDEALQSMVDAGEVTQYDAYQHQRARDKAETILETEERIFSKLNKESEEDIRKKDADEVLAKYPQFSKNHPDYDPDDPLLKQVNRLWTGGFHTNPRGFSESVKLAEEMLGFNKKRPDRTDDFSVTGSDVNNESRPSDKIVISEDERNLAIRNYHFGGLTNPLTGRVYTEKEAVERYTREKESRIKSRSRRI